MDLAVNNINNNLGKRKYTPTFKGPLDGAVTGVLRTLTGNEMANAVVLDLGTMVAPRTYFDTKDRNKYAGAETFTREISGTFVNCLSAGLFGSIIAKIAAKSTDKKVKINPKSWFSEDSIAVLKNAWDKSGNKTEKYVENVLNGITAIDGKNKVSYKASDWAQTEWFGENKWGRYKFDNPKYANVEEKIKTKDGFVQTFKDAIEDKNLTKRDKKHIFKIFETRLTNALKANNDINVQVGERNLNTNISNLLRDTYDMAHDVFTNKNADTMAALKKIKKVNNIKIFGALSLASALGISVQKINRTTTEKRTGKKGFVGEVDYVKDLQDKKAQKNLPADKKIEQTKPEKNGSKKLWISKLLASAGMVAMVMGVMRVKSPKDFVKKLQFTGPVSTGNAIKTVYMSTIIGRFLAADSMNELRESVVRDYFGFLNWLVLGGFAAKGVANILDPKRENLFNIKKEGKGVKHWLNDLSLKSYEEVAAHGAEFAKKNIKKLNIAQIAGLAYSTIMLGIILPKINTKMTAYKGRKKEVPPKTELKTAA